MQIRPSGDQCGHESFSCLVRGSRVLRVITTRPAPAVGCSLLGCRRPTVDAREGAFGADREGDVALDGFLHPVGQAAGEHLAAGTAIGLEQRGWVAGWLEVTCRSKTSAARSVSWSLVET